MSEGIQTKTILDVSAENKNGAPYEVHTQGGSGLTLQVVIVGTATVALQGSNNNEDWVGLASTSASAGYELKAPWKYVRAVSSSTTGTAKVIVGV